MKLYPALLTVIIMCHYTYAENLAEYHEHDLVNLDALLQSNTSPTEKLPLVNDLPKDFQQLFHMGNDALRSGNLDRAIDLFIKSIEINGNAPQIYFNLGFAYETKGEVDKAIEEYKAAILRKLDYPKAHLQLAKLLHQRNLIDEAIIHYQHAVNLNQSLTTEALTVARLLCDQERFEEAGPYFKLAHKGRPEDVTIRFEYANALNTSGYTIEALEHYLELLKQRPNDSSILYNTAYSFKKLGRLEEAMPYYKKALERNPDHAEAHFSLGLAYLIRGDFEHGWPEYEWRWQRNSQLKPRNFPKPQWDGSPLEGKTILIHAEQGLGDTFQFIRYARTIREQHDCKIICAVQRPLHTIISRCCPYIDSVTTLSEIPTSFDVHIPLMTIPLVLKSNEQTIPKTIPYIFPDEHLVELWKHRLPQDGTLKIGICWQGNSKYGTPMLRATVAAKSLRAHRLTPLSDIEGISLYNLQKENGEEQVKSLPKNFNLKTFDVDFDTINGRFMDTAAIIKNLDLVITVDTSIAHLAGAIGTPAWIMLPEPADWRWLLNRNNTPWYSNTRLFRQPHSGDWNSVVAAIVEELKKLTGAKASTTAPIIPQTTPQQTKEPNTIRSLLRKPIQSIVNAEDDAALIKAIKTAYHLQNLFKLLDNNQIVPQESA